MDHTLRTGLNPTKQDLHQGDYVTRLPLCSFALAALVSLLACDNNPASSSPPMDAATIVPTDGLATVDSSTTTRPFDAAAQPDATVAPAAVMVSNLALPGPPVGPGALAIDASNGTAYVLVVVPGSSGPLNGTLGVVVIDIVTSTIKTTIAIPGSGTFDLNDGAVAVDSSTHAVYAAGYDTHAMYPHGETLTLIDGTTNTVTGTIATIPVPFIVYLAVDPSTHHVFGYDALSKVAVIDGTAKTLITTITMAGYDTNLAGNYNGGLAVDPASHRVWALGPSADTLGVATTSMVTTIDGTANTAGTQTSFPGVPGKLVAESGAGGLALVTTLSPSAVNELDPATLMLPPDFTPDAIAYHPPANGFGEFISVIGHDAKNNTLGVNYIRCPPGNVWSPSTVYSMSNVKMPGFYFDTLFDWNPKSSVDYSVIALGKSGGGTSAYLPVVERVDFTVSNGPGSTFGTLGCP